MAAGASIGMAADHVQVLNGAVLADDRLQDHDALNTGLLGQRRIRGLHLVDQKPCETPCDTRTRCGVATLGTAVGALTRSRRPERRPCAARTPPGTPPTTPATPVDARWRLRLP